MKKTRKIRYAVVGLGHIAQVAVLPAFKHAKNSELLAFVSDDPQKIRKLERQYGVQRSYSYEEYEECLGSGEIDAVYIALPNSMHSEFTQKAAKHGIHVLCEKPMAITEEECRQMIEACRKHEVKLMIAYRLHFEEANLKAIEAARKGALGELRIFNSVFTMQVKSEDNIRLRKQMGGGTIYDIGIYCINAARYLFQDEPLEVFAQSANNGEPRFSEVDEMTSVILRFPRERLATFTCSFGAYDVSNYQLVGTQGALSLDPAYEYAMELKSKLSRSGKTREKTFSKRDQFGPELLYFSDCILKNHDPEPSGEEGLADVKIINAIYRSAKLGKPVSISKIEKKAWPSLKQEIHRPAVKKPKVIHAPAPSEG